MSSFDDGFSGVVAAVVVADGSSAGLGVRLLDPLLLFARRGDAIAND